MKAICYLTGNKNTQEMERRYNLLPSGNNFIIYDKKEDLKYSENVKTHVYEYNSYIFTPSYEHNTIVRMTYIPILDFFKKNQNFDYYWLLEDDVIFNGDFSLFFDTFENNDSDYIITEFDPDLKENLKDIIYARIYNWENVERPLIGGLVVMQRFSNRMLKKLLKMWEHKVYGHTESYPATVAHLNKYKIDSIENYSFFKKEYCRYDGKFTPNDVKTIPKNILIHAVKF